MRTHIALCVALVFLTACAVSPERVRGEELEIDAAYRDFDCPALAVEAERLNAEIERAEKVANSPTRWIPFVNLLTFAAEARGVKDLEDAQARLAGVERAQVERACSP